MKYKKRLVKIIGIILSVAFIMPLLSGCSEKKDVAKLESVLFTRTGAVLVLSEARDVSEVKVADKKVDFTQPNTMTILASFEWEPSKKCAITIKSEEGVINEETVSPKKPSAYKLGEAKLGSLEKFPQVESWKDVPSEETIISPDGKYIAMASFDGKFYVFDNAGKKLWNYQVPDGVGKKVAFSGNGEILLAGEASADGYLYAFNTKTGEEIWKYKVSDDVGTSTDSYWYYRPMIYSLTVSGDTAFAAGQLKQKEKKMVEDKEVTVYKTKCFIYAFDVESGKTKWRFPEDEPMDTGVPKVVATPDGNKVMFVNQSWNYGAVQEKYPDGTIRLLNGETGKEMAAYKVDALEPYFKFVGIWDGICISPDGNHFTAMAGDGRGFLFDLTKAKETSELRLVWMKEISKIQEVSGVPIYAYGNGTHVDNEGNAVFATSVTYSADKTKCSGTPPAVHPDATTIFAYSNEGKLQWKWKAEGKIGCPLFSQDNRYMVVGVAHDWVSQNKDMAGVQCFDLTKEGNASDKLCWFYPVEGICAIATISNNGESIAAIEAPIQMEDKSISGNHKIHFVR